MDFSNRIRNRNAAGPAPESNNTAADGPSLGAILQSRPLLTGLAIIAVLAFGLGVMAGVPIGKMQQQEADVSARVKKRKADNKGKKPGDVAGGDSRNTGSTSIAGIAHGGSARSTGGSAGNSGNGSENTGRNGNPNSNRLMNPSASGAGSSSYVITLGTYSAANAKKLLLRMNRLEAVAAMRPAPCRTLEETIPNRSLGFRLRHPSNRRLNRVYLGCFRREGDAQRVLRAIRDSRIIPISHAKLISF